MKKYAFIIKGQENLGPNDFIITEVAKVGMFWFFDTLNLMNSDDTELLDIVKNSIVFCEVIENPKGLIFLMEEQLMNG